MFEAIIKYDFLKNAVLVSIFAAIICGIIGVIIVEKKMLMMTGGISHTAYGGVGLGYLLGFEPIIGAGIFAVISAILIGAIRRKNSTHTDIIISLLWSLGMALGIAFIATTPGYPPDINSYLFGNILSVTKSDIYTISSLSAIVLLTVLIFYNDLKAFLFDSKFSKISGIKTDYLEYSVLILIALSIVALIRVVGIILVIALLTAPAACSAFFSKNLKGRFILATVFSCAFCFLGLAISYNFGIPSGASIVFVSVITYFVIFTINKLIKVNR